MDMINSNKNFKSKQAKQLIMSTEEYSYFMRYLAIKEKLEIGNQEYLFLKRDQTDDVLNRNVIGKWSTVLESHLHLSVKINTNVWRQSLCTIFSQNISDLPTQSKIDRHVGHTRRLGEIFYELNSKTVDAIVTARAVENDLSDNVTKAIEEKTVDAVVANEWCIRGKTFESIVTPTNEMIADVDTSALNETMGNKSDLSNSEGESDMAANVLARGLTNSNEDESDADDENTLLSEATETKLSSTDKIVSFLTKTARKLRLNGEQYCCVAEYYDRCLKGIETRNQRTLFCDVQKIHQSKEASYDHINFLIKKLSNWKEQGFPEFQ